MRGRVRTSTVVLLLVFVASLVTYALVRPPAPGDREIIPSTRNLRQAPEPTREPAAPLVPGVPEEPRSESPSPSPSASPSPAGASVTPVPSPSTVSSGPVGSASPTA